MSAKCPLICSAVELWYKMMLEIRNQSELAENHIKRKAAGYQRLSSNWLWLFMAAYKPSFSVEKDKAHSLVEISLKCCIELFPHIAKFKCVFASLFDIEQH